MAKRSHVVASAPTSSQAVTGSATRFLTYSLLYTCRTIADECCFGAPPSPGVINYQLHDWVERDLCGSRPWLVLHKVRAASRSLP